MFRLTGVLDAQECWGLFEVGSGSETGSACCVHSYWENLIKATLALSEIDLDIALCRCFKHCDLLAGTMEDAERVLTFFPPSLRFHPNASHFPPILFCRTPFRHHQPSSISLSLLGEKLHPLPLACATQKNGTLSTDKRELLQLRAADEAAGQRQSSDNDWTSSSGKKSLTLK